jgi:hypothetical protein
MSPLFPGTRLRRPRPRQGGGGGPRRKIAFVADPDEGPPRAPGRRGISVAAGERLAILGESGAIAVSSSPRTGRQQARRPMHAVLPRLFSSSRPRSSPLEAGRIRRALPGTWHPTSSARSAGSATTTSRTTGAGALTGCRSRGARAASATRRSGRRRAGTRSTASSPRPRRAGRPVAGASSFPPGTQATRGRGRGAPKVFGTLDPPAREVGGSRAPSPGGGSAFVLAELKKTRKVDEALVERAAQSLLALGDDGFRPARRARTRLRHDAPSSSPPRTSSCARRAPTTRTSSSAA